MAFSKEPSGGGVYVGIARLQTPGAGDPRALAPDSLASSGINEARHILYARYTLVLSSSLSAAGLLSFIAGCRPVSGADAVPDNEQYISAGGVGRGVGRGERPS